jgi:hypothetical protein
VTLSRIEPATFRLVAQCLKPTGANEKTPLDNQKKENRRKIFKIIENARIQSGNQTNNYSFENSDHDAQITRCLTGNTS